MRRALVFGGYGFLGRHAVTALLDAGWDARCAPPQDDLDLTTAAEDDLVALLRAERPDAIVNATGAVVGSAQELQQANVEVVRRLVTASTRATPGVRIVHLGSIAEYGNGTGRPLREDCPPEPVTPYAVSKLRGTRTLLAASASGEVDAVVLRVANPVGARQPAATVLGSVIAQVRADPTGDLTLGVLDGFRDFVPARDVGTAIALAAAAPLSQPEDRLVNVGTGIPNSVRDVVHALLAIAGFEGRLVERARTGSSRSAAVHAAVADVRRAGQVLGWCSGGDLLEALRDVVVGAGLPVPTS